ncbi:nucleotidyltransferase family protein, partial [Phenylobacterium sp.]
LERFVSTTNAVGVRLEADDRLTLSAPFGLEDLFSLRLRPNPNRPAEGFRRKVSGVLARWPELQVADAD